MKRSPRFYSMVFGLVALGGLTGFLAWSRLAELEGENQSLRARVAELSQAPADSDPTELLRLRQENAALQSALSRMSSSSSVAAQTAPAETAPPEPANRGARLGISIADVADRRGSNPALNLPDGVLVTQVAPNSPAGQSGLAANDVILDVDGNPATSAAEFRDAVSRRTPGSTVTLVVFRQGLNLRIVSATDRWPDPP